MVPWLHVSPKPSGEEVEVKKRGRDYKLGIGKSVE